MLFRRACFTSRLNMNLREEHAYTYGGGNAQNLATRALGRLLQSPAACAPT